MADDMKDKEQAPEKKGSVDTAKSLFSKAIQLLKDPFEILRYMKEYTHLLKPTPMQFFFLLGVALFVWVLALLLDAIFGIGVVLNPIIDWLLMTPFMFIMFWLFGSSYAKRGKTGGVAGPDQKAQVFKRIVANGITDIANIIIAGALPTWIVNVIISTGISWSDIIIDEVANGENRTIGMELEERRRIREEMKKAGKAPRAKRFIGRAAEQEGKEEGNDSAGSTLYSPVSSAIKGVEFRRSGTTEKIESRR